MENVLTDQQSSILEPSKRLSTSQTQRERSHCDMPNNSGSDGGKESPTAIEVYWATYGGWWALLRSPFFWSSVLLTVICYPVWLSNPDGERAWIQYAIDIVPGTLGFSLGGMAILLAFSSPRLLKAIRSDGHPGSLFMVTSAAFFHFILLQTSSICVALISKAHDFDVISAFGFFLTCYGTLAAIAIASMLLNMARVFNATATIGEKNDDAP